MPIPIPIGAALISGGLGIAGGLLSGRSRRRQFARQRGHNMEMAKYEWQKNLEMWRRQNEYNTPSAQMRRFKEAGLNPNLIYGQGTHGNAQQMPQFRRPEMPYDMQALLDPTSAIGAGSQVIGSMLDNVGKGADNAIKKLMKDQAITETLTVELRNALEQMMLKHIKGDADNSDYKDVMLMVENWRAQQDSQGVQNALQRIQIKLTTEQQRLAKKGLAPQGNQYVQLLREVITILTNPLEWFNSMKQ